MDPYHRARRTQTRLGICLLLFGGLIRAQGVGQFDPRIPTCISPWSLLNDDGRTPCQMLFAMMDPCTLQDNGQPFNLPNISSLPDEVYPAPSSEFTSLERCQCTEAGYNLYSSCTACQLGINNDTHWLNRNAWFTSCTSTRSGQVQALPPSAVADEFDKWITQVYEPKFSVSAALNAGNNPNAGNSVSVASTGAASTIALGSPTSTPGSVAAEGVSSASSTMISIGAIVGTVVGVIAFLAFIFIVVWVCYRRRKAQRTAPSAEFMKYANTREPLRSHSRANTGDEEGLMGMPLGPNSYGPHRGSVARVDSPDLNNSYHDGGGGGDIEMSEGGPNGAPPAFTPGLFKDPIFEKGVALNLAAAAAANHSGAGGAGAGGLGAGPGGPYGGSPVTYSPATPSTAHAGMERQGLI